MGGQSTGYICTLIACLCFGTNYVPAKKVDIKDGQFFSFCVAIGIAVVGVTQWLAMGMYKFEPLAMIGGATWAVANLFVPFIIKRCGLGIGQLGWCASNMLTGWATGSFGLFGITKSVVAHPGLNYLGVAISVGALLVITQLGKKAELKVNPKLLNDAETARVVDAVEEQAQAQVTTPLADVRASRVRGCSVVGALLLVVLIVCAVILAVYQGTVSTVAMAVMIVAVLALSVVGVVVMVSRSLIQSAEPSHKEPTLETDTEPQPASTSSSFIVQTPTPAPDTSAREFSVGLVAALFAGVLMGCNFDVPTLLQQQGEAHGHSSNSLDYVFSHYMGILLLTSSYFCVYKLTAKECYVGKEIVLPGLFAGVLWGIAQLCWFYANSALSFVVTFPIITGVPGVLSIICGMVIFGENTDRRSRKLIATIVGLTATSLGCIAISHGPG